MRFWLLPLVLMSLLGCGGVKKDTGALIPLTQLPRPVRQSAYYKVTGARYHSALLFKDGRYQIRGQDQAGNPVTVDVAADGTLLRVQN